jgi:hypothetical protein
MLLPPMMMLLEGGGPEVMYILLPMPLEDAMPDP